MKLKSIIVFCSFLVLSATINTHGQDAYFADGYHGGIYGHYPMWQTGFLVDKLTANPEWMVNLEIEPETWDVVKEKDPQKYHRLQKYFADTLNDHRIEFVNPAYAQPYCFNISGESIIRHFAYGIDKVKQHFPQATFKTYSCEEPCFTSCLPQLLCSFGYKYAVLRNPDTCWGGYTSPFGKDLVNWISSDGSSIPTVPRYACEELEEGSTWQTASWDNSKEFIKSCFDDGIKYPVGMCFQDAGWKGGPWLGSVIKDYYKPSHYVSWTQYIDMISDKVKPDDWHFSIEDVKPGLVWGSQILQKLAQEVRYTENHLVMAEKVAAFSSAFHNFKYPSDQFYEAWRTLMLSQHHDCWIVPYNGRPGGNWATNVTEWTTASNKIADQTIAKALHSIPTGTNSADTGIIAFNTLGQKRSSLTQVTLPANLNPNDYTITDLSGTPVISQPLSDSKTIAFTANTPAYGYSTFKLSKKSTSTQPIAVRTLADNKLVITTNYYNAVIDPSRGGALTSLVRNNIQLIKPGQALNSMEGYLYEQEKFVNTADSPAQVSVTEHGPLFVKLKVDSAFDGIPYTQHITFFQNNPRIDFELDINWNKKIGIGAYSQYKNFVKEDPKKAFYNDKYKLHVRFPIVTRFTDIYKNAPFDVCKSELKNTLYDGWDNIKHNVILNWVDLADKAGRMGVALFSDHTTSYINTRDLPLGLTVQYIGRGLWGMNYKVDGPTHIKYALLVHEGNWHTANLEYQSRLWNEPLIASYADKTPIANSCSLLEISQPYIQLVSSIASPDSSTIRLYNASPEPTQASVILHQKPTAVNLVNLDGSTIQKISPELVSDNNWKITFNMTKFGVNTLLIK